jgi:short-subunit dehydrogenase
MIKQRRGHLIGISSITTKCPFPHTVIYTTTKYGNKAFMDTLREDMCQFGFDDFIKISTVFPGFVRTNDGMTSMISENFLESVFMFTEPDYAANEIVKGILKNEENVYVSWLEVFQTKCLSLFARPFKRILLRNSLQSLKRDEFIKNKMKKCNLLKIE